MFNNTVLNFKHSYSFQVFLKKKKKEQNPKGWPAPPCSFIYYKITTTCKKGITFILFCNQHFIFVCNLMKTCNCDNKYFMTNKLTCLTRSHRKGGFSFNFFLLFFFFLIRFDVVDGEIFWKKKNAKKMTHVV